MHDPLKSALSDLRCSNPESGVDDDLRLVSFPADALMVGRAAAGEIDAWLDPDVEEIVPRIQAGSGVACFTCGYQ